MRKLLLLSLIGLGSTWFAHSQYTQIPDPYFEHALIDLGIDSDGEINGQVLTSDIENIEVLRLYNVIFNNLIGLEDFTSLKTLDLVFCRTNSHLDLSIAPTLEVFKIYGKTDNIDTNLTDVDLTNNPNLRKIEFRDDWVIRRINLKGSDQYIDSLYIGYSPGGDIPFRGTQNNGNEMLLCVEVTNPEDAENQQGDYANWEAWGVYYTTDCTLSVSDFEIADFKIYPNPSKEFFKIETTVEMELISVYDVQGKKMKTFAGLQENYPVTDLSTGLYFLKIQLRNGENFMKRLLIE